MYEIIFNRAILSQIIEIDNWESKVCRLESIHIKEMNHLAHNIPGWDSSVSSNYRVLHQTIPRPMFTVETVQIIESRKNIREISRPMLRRNSQFKPTRFKQAEEKKERRKSGVRTIDGEGVNERRRWGVASVPVIRAGRTLSDRNGAIIRGSRDVKRSALCAHRPYE